MFGYISVVSLITNYECHDFSKLNISSRLVSAMLASLLVSDWGRFQFIFLHVTN